LVAGVPNTFSPIVPSRSNWAITASSIAAVVVVAVAVAVAVAVTDVVVPLKGKRR
jgi:hypothetical protein